MKQITYICTLLLAFCFGCGPTDAPPEQPELDQVHELYNQLTLSQDTHGFVDTDHCDALLFSGMISAGGFEVDVAAAESTPGRWYRKPTSYPECWASGNSRSTISRDMLLGVYWHAWTHRDLAMLERLWDYGWRHAWKMGDGRLAGADTLMNTAMISTLAEMIYRLGGDNHWLSRRLPTSFSTTDEEGQMFRNRLTALHLGLRYRVYGSLSKKSQLVLTTLAVSWPDNPLFLWAARDYVGAAKQLERGADSPTSGTHSQDEYPYEWAFVAGMLQREFP